MMDDKQYFKIVLLVVGLLISFGLISFGIGIMVGRVYP